MTAIRDFLMKMEGMEVNIEAQPTAKQWAAIVQWVGELKKATEAPASAIVTNGVNHAPVQVTNGIGETDILAQVNAIKKAGASGQSFSGQAADAGPPPAARKR